MDGTNFSPQVATASSPTPATPTSGDHAETCVSTLTSLSLSVSAVFLVRRPRLCRPGLADRLCASPLLRRSFRQPFRLLRRRCLLRSRVCVVSLSSSLRCFLIFLPFLYSSCKLNSTPVCPPPCSPTQDVAPSLCSSRARKSPHAHDVVCSFTSCPLPFSRLESSSGRTPHVRFCALNLFPLAIPFPLPVVLPFPALFFPQFSVFCVHSSVFHGFSSSFLFSATPSAPFSLFASPARHLPRPFFSFPVLPPPTLHLASRFCLHSDSKASCVASFIFRGACAQPSPPFPPNDTPMTPSRAGHLCSSCNACIGASDRSFRLFALFPESATRTFARHPASIRNSSSFLLAPPPLVSLLFSFLRFFHCP